MEAYLRLVVACQDCSLEVVVVDHMAMLEVVHRAMQVVVHRAMPEVVHMVRQEASLEAFQTHFIHHQEKLYFDLKHQHLQEHLAKM